MNICSLIGKHRRCHLRMNFVALSVIWTLSTIVTGTDYLISVHRPSSVDVTTNGEGGSVRVSYPNHNLHLGYGVSSRRSGIRLDKTISTILGFDNSTVLISCSHSAMKVTVYSDSYKYNVFLPLPANALGTRYVVSSCHQMEIDFSVLVITAYKHNADVAIRFDTNIAFPYGGQMYRKGDTLSFSLRAYQTFTFRVNHDISGTRIISSQPIAVFSGTANIATVYTYTQLLPVEQFSDEYVVTVNDSLPPFQLQIISEHNGIEITFNNGTSASIQSNILNRNLKKNETFHFVSNKPVIATICRSVGDQKGFALIPPVSSYRDQERLTLVYTSLIVTLNTVYMDIPNYFIGGWEYISHSKFKVGRFWYKYRRDIAATGQSKFSIVFTFGPQTFYIDGLSLEEEDQSITDPTYTFIVVTPKFRYARTRIVAVGDQEARYQMRCSGNERVKTRIIHPYVAHYLVIPSHSVCVVETDNEHLHFFLLDTSRNRVLSVSLFPVASIGIKYVIPSYDVSMFSNGRIILATGNWTASVDVTRKNGIVARYDLVEYQTAIVDNEVSGIVVSASREIVVFMENIYVTGYKYMYAQLVPSENFGNEYVLAVGSITINKFRYIHNLTEEYYINITCLDTNTTIMFNDGVTVTTDKTKFYQRDVVVNESLRFTSSKPVMSYLCLKIEFQSKDDVYKENPCTILPPVERYDDSAVINIPVKADLKIMTKQDNDDFHAYTLDYRLQKTPIIVSWENIPNTDYKIGTAANRGGIIFLKSTQRFSAIIYGYMDSSNPGRYTLFNIYTSSPSVHQRTPRLSTTAELAPTDIPDGNSDGNVVMGEDNGVTTLIVGCVCGIIILALVCIVAFLFIRMKRNAQLKSKTEPRNRHSAALQPTTFEMDHVTRDRGHGMGTEGNTYSDMTSEGKVVKSYENVVCTGQNKDSPFEKSNSKHGNTYSDLTRQTEDDYDIIDHVRQDNAYVNM